VENTYRRLFKNGRQIFGKPGESFYERIRPRRHDRASDYRRWVAEAFIDAGAGKALHLARALPAVSQRKVDDLWMGNKRGSGPVSLCPKVRSS